MQADPWPRVASTTLGKVAALGRENEPEEEKIGCERFAQGDTRPMAGNRGNVEAMPARFPNLRLMARLSSCLDLADR